MYVNFVIKIIPQNADCEMRSSKQHWNKFIDQQ